MMSIMPCLLNCGGILRFLLHHYEVVTWEINIVKNLHPTKVRNSGASHIWRKMITMREEIEHDIWWQVKAGNSNFWFDNWTK